MKRLSSTIALLALSLCAGLTASAQTRTVSGSVKGSDGEILPGASVVSTKGSPYVIADMDGKFEIAAKTGDSFTVSFFGYDDTVFTVKDGVDNYPVVLPVSAATMLDETVVIGYGTTTKKEVTGSVTSIRSESLDKGSYIDASAMLQGKVAGLSITNPNGGDPNGSMEIILRGTNTLSAGQGPLIIIDGVSGADLQTINFQEVETIDVLKIGRASCRERV